MCYLKIEKIEYIKDYTVAVFFKNGQKRIADFKYFVFKHDSPMVRQFQDIERFKKVYLDCGHLTWEDGQMDISEESIYNNEFS